MATRPNYGGGASTLPLHLLSQAVPMLSRHELAALTERLIERLDALDGDPDIEDDTEDCAVDDAGCDDAEQGDIEMDASTHLAPGLYGADQRRVLKRGQFGIREVFRHE